MADDEYRQAKDAAREQAVSASNDAAQAFKSAGNFLKKTFGKKKKKHAPKADPLFAGSVFDWDFYYDAHPDVVKARMDLADHWRRYGFNEGRQGSPEFSAAFYLQKYPDLRNWLGATNYQGALTHWLDHGIAEGRQGSANFSVGAYLSRYPDLQRAFGANNYDAAFDHWMEWGQGEGRSGAP